MTNIHPLFKTAGESPSKSGGGPEDPMLEKRVEVLEQKVDRILEVIERITVLVRELADDSKDLRKTLVEIHLKMATRDDLSDARKEVSRLKEDTSELKGRFDGLDKRFAYIPSTWQMLTFMLGSQIAFAGILFTALKFGLK